VPILLPGFLDAATRMSVRPLKPRVVYKTLTFARPQPYRRRLASCVSTFGWKAVLENVGGVGGEVCDTGGYYDTDQAGRVLRRTSP
jgi:hypothetical protein